MLWIYFPPTSLFCSDQNCRNRHSGQHDGNPGSPPTIRESDADRRTHTRHLADHLVQQHPMPVCSLGYTPVNSPGNQLEHTLSSRIEAVHIERRAVCIKIISGLPEPLPSISDTPGHLFQFCQLGLNALCQSSPFVIFTVHKSIPSFSTIFSRLGGQVSTSVRSISNSWLKPVTSATAR